MKMTIKTKLLKTKMYFLCVDTRFCSKSDGFMSLSLITNASYSYKYFPTITSSRRSRVNFWSWIFPNSLVFSCDGLLKRWIFRAENITLGDNIKLPGWGVYYRRQRRRGYYYRVRHLIQPTKVEYARDGVYQYILSSPLRVHSGDVVGVQYQNNPSSYTDILKLAFMDTRSNGKKVSYRNTRGTHFWFLFGRNIQYIEDTQYLPLVTPVLCKQMLLFFISSYCVFLNICFNVAGATINWFMQSRYGYVHCMVLLVFIESMPIKLFQK